MTTLLLAISYLITPVGMLFLLLSFIYAPSKSNRYVLFWGLTFGVIGYCSVPIREIDITRYFQMIDNLRGMALHEAMAGNGNGLVVTTFWFWLVSKIGDNNILPFMSMTTIYSILCYIVVDSLKERKKAIKYLLLLLVLRLPFYSVYSNVRNVSAFALLALALYRDLIKNKRGIITITLYIVPCFIHMTGFLIVLLRLFLPFIRKFPIFSIASTLGIPAVSILVYTKFRSLPIPGGIGSIVNRAIWKAYTSTMADSEYAQITQGHLSFLASRLVTISLLICFLILIILYIRRMKRVSDFLLIESIVVSVALIWASLGIVKYWIMVYMASLLSPPVISEIIFQRSIKLPFRKLMLQIMILSCCMNLPLQVHRILSNFDLRLLFMNMFLNNYLTIIIKAVFGVLLNVG